MHMKITKFQVNRKHSSISLYLNTKEALLHVRALAPVRKGLLPQFPSRCCLSRLKVHPLDPVQSTGAIAPFNTGWLYQPILKGPARAATLHDPLTPVGKGSFFLFFGSFIWFYLLFIYNNRFVNMYYMLI